MPELGCPALVIESRPRSQRSESHDAPNAAGLNSRRTCGMSWAGAHQINIEQYRSRSRLSPSRSLSRNCIIRAYRHCCFDLLLASPLALRLPASAASDGAFRPGAPGVLHRGAGRHGRGRAVARIPCRRGRDPDRGAADARLPYRARGGRGAAGAARPAARSRGDKTTRPVLFHAIGAQVFRPRRRLAGRLRLHGRAFRVQRRAAGNRRARAGVARPRGSRLHRRREPVRGQAPSASERPCLPQQRRCRPFCARPSAAVRPRGPGADPQAAAGLLRRHRRAARHRADRCRCGHAPGVAAGHGRGRW